MYKTYSGLHLTLFESKDTHTGKFLAYNLLADECSSGYELIS